MFRVLRALVAIYVLVLTGLFFYQDHLVFRPHHLETDFKYDFRGPFEEKFLHLPSGSDVNYVVFDAPQPLGVILYFHGNGGSLASWGKYGAELAAKTRREVWMMDYPGFGKSTGAVPHNDDELLLLGKSFAEEIHHSRPGLPLYLYGRSIGTGIAALLARSEPSDGLVLETPYTSLADMSLKEYPWVPTFLLHYKLDNTLLQNSGVRNIMIFHGTDDEVVPYSQGEALGKLLKVKFVSIPRGKHNNLAKFPAYWQAITSYFPIP